MDDGKRRRSRCEHCGGPKPKWWQKYCGPECAHAAAAIAYQMRHKLMGRCVRCPRKARKGFLTCKNHPDSRTEQRKAA
jgi:hypothetical protein